MKRIGIVKGVDENDITFISSMKLKNGDFVAYVDRWIDRRPSHPVPGQICTISKAVIRMSFY